MLIFVFPVAPPRKPLAEPSRKLLKLVEHLQLERARCVDGSGEVLGYHRHAATTSPFVSGGSRRRQEDKVTADLSNNFGDNNNKNNSRSENHGDEDGDEGFASPPVPRPAGRKPRARRDSATQPRFDPTPPLSREDVRRLRLENRNMHLLLVENRELKSQVREQSASAEGVRRELAAELGRVTGQLRGALRELQEARARLLLLQQPAETAVSSPGGEGIASRCVGRVEPEERVPLLFLPIG